MIVATDFREPALPKGRFDLSLSKYRSGLEILVIVLPARLIVAAGVQLVGRRPLQHFFRDHDPIGILEGIDDHIDFFQKFSINGIYGQQARQVQPGIGAGYFIGMMPAIDKEGWFEDRLFGLRDKGTGTGIRDGNGKKPETAGGTALFNNFKAGLAGK